MSVGIEAGASGSGVNKDRTNEVIDQLAVSKTGLNYETLVGVASGEWMAFTWRISPGGEVVHSAVINTHRTDPEQEYPDAYETIQAVSRGLLNTYHAGCMDNALSAEEAQAYVNELDSLFTPGPRE